LFLKIKFSNLILTAFILFSTFIGNAHAHTKEKKKLMAHLVCEDAVTE